MFSAKPKSEFSAAPASGSATLISAGTVVTGDVKSDSDLRIDGTIKGNIHCAAKIVIGASGIVEGDMIGLHADIMGKIEGNIRVRELVQLRGESVIHGNIFAGRLQVEPSATFNGQCHMGANIVEMNNNEQQAAAR